MNEFELKRHVALERVRLWCAVFAAAMGNARGVELAKEDADKAVEFFDTRFASV
jgi:hypothetical protein